MPITAQTAEVKAGTIADFAGSTAPAGWLIADGSAISRTLYSALFNYCGTSHGVGDGTTTFNIPDCRGEFRRGLDNGRGIDTGRTLGSAQANDVQAHNHSVEMPQWNGAQNGRQYQGGGSAYFTTASAANTNNNTGTETRPRNKAFLTCIKF